LHTRKREEKAAFVLQKKQKLLTRDIFRTSPAPTGDLHNCPSCAPALS
jgi:hypothetical protein